MPNFRTAANTYCQQLQPGEPSTGGLQNTAGGNSGFKHASPDLYYRLTPYGHGHIFQLGRPWPMSPYSSDRGNNSNFIALAGNDNEWRLVQFGQLAAPGALPPIEGTASLTEADDTLSATGTLTIKGQAAITEEGDTLAATGALAIAGALTATEADDILAATGTLLIKADANIIESDDTLTATGALGDTITGTLAVTEADDTLAATGVLAIAASLSVTEANDTLGATATIPVTVPLGGGLGPIPVNRHYETQRVQWPLMGLLARTEFDFVLETAPRWPEPVVVAPVKPQPVIPDIEPEPSPPPLPPPEPITVEWATPWANAESLLAGVIIDMRGVRIAKKRREARAVELAMAYDRDLVAAYLEKKGLRL